VAGAHQRRRKSSFFIFISPVRLSEPASEGGLLDGKQPIREQRSNDGYQYPVEAAAHRNIGSSRSKLLCSLESGACSLHGWSATTVREDFPLITITIIIIIIHFICIAPLRFWMFCSVSPPCLQQMSSSLPPADHLLPLSHFLCVVITSCVSSSLPVCHRHFLPWTCNLWA